MTSFTKFLVPVLAIILLAAGGLYFVKSRVAQTPIARQAGSTNTSAEVGSILPDFPLNGIQGQSSKVSELKAKVVLINFWATWCEACMEEMPSLIRLRNAYKNKGFEVVGINLDENAETVLPKAEKELGINFPVFNDPNNQLTDYFDVHAIPLSVVLGPGRKILYIENGERDWNDQDTHQQLDQWLRNAKT